jgi:mannose-6-phosphate isomerase-like protein (cupin superfamily)
MLSFLAVHPPRTKIAHLNRIPFDDGRSIVEFKSPLDSYLVINRLPPAASDKEVETKKVPNKANCALAPPLHWHYYQDETFHVLNGTAKFTLDGKERIANAGETVFIPKQQFHTFCNASEEIELSVEFVLEPGTRKNDEAYFSTTSIVHDKVPNLKLIFPHRKHLGLSRRLQESRTPEESSSGASLYASRQCCTCLARS